MLALYPAELQDTSTSGSALLLDDDILEAMETTSLLVPDRRPQAPLNLMGAGSEEEQRAWSRGANSDTSVRYVWLHNGIYPLVEIPYKVTHSLISNYIFAFVAFIANKTACQLVATWEGAFLVWRAVAH